MGPLPKIHWYDVAFAGLFLTAVAIAGWELAKWLVSFITVTVDLNL